MEGDSKGGISRLAKMRKPQCTAVHEDFRIKRNAESTLLSHPLDESPEFIWRYSSGAWRLRAGVGLAEREPATDFEKRDLPCK